MTTLSYTAIPADAFVDSIGVNIHGGFGAVNRPDYTNAQSQDFVSLISWLGVRHVRDNGVYVGPSDSYTKSLQVAAELTAAGIKTLYVVPGAAALTSLLANYPQPEAVEPYNEWDLAGGSGWATDLASFQPTLYADVKAQWSTTTVLGPALGHLANYPLTSMSPNLDINNAHFYARPGVNPEYFSPATVSAASTTFQTGGPGLPYWVTETGRVVGAYQSYQSEIGEYSGAAQLLRTLIHSVAPASAANINSRPFSTGTGGFAAARVYLFELIDEHVQAATTEDRYGLFTGLLTPKHTAWAVRNLISILSDPGGGSLTGGSLSVTLAGLSAINLSSVLYQKLDGSLWLAYWLPTDSVTYPSGNSGSVPVTGAELANTPSSFTLTFSQAYGGTQLFRPLLSSQPVQSFNVISGSAVSLTATYDPQFLRLSPSPLMRSNQRGLRNRYATRPAAAANT